MRPWRRVGIVLAALVLAAAADMGRIAAAAARTEPAKTQERPYILAFVPPANAGALPRLRAELGVAGFELRLSDAAAGWPPSREEMERQARGQSAVAALALIPKEDGTATEIWVVDRVTGKSVVRLFSAAPPGHGDEAELLAVSAVETLRATLMEIDLGQPARGEVAPPPAVRALVGADTQRFAARLGTGLGYSRDGLGAAWQLAIALTAALGPRLRLGVAGFVPLTSAAVSGPEGQADVRLWLAGPFLEMSLTDPAARGELSLGAGAWACLLRMRGNAAPPYMGVPANVATVAPHADIGFRWRLGRRLGVGGVLAVAVAAPEAVVRFSGRDAARWGRPFGLAALVVEARLD